MTTLFGTTCDNCGRLMMVGKGDEAECSACLVAEDASA